VIIGYNPGPSTSTANGAVTTGISDQKFGFTLTAGMAADAVASVLAHPDSDLIGAAIVISARRSPDGHALTARTFAE